MTTDQEQTAPEADDNETSGRPAQTVRVPNVSPNAKSGLDHTIIGSNALEGAGDPADDADPFDHPGDDSVPQGDLDAALAWLAEAEDSDTARARADAVWSAYADTSGDDPSGDPANTDLAVALHKAVYGDTNPATQPDGGQGAVANNTLLGTVTVPEGLEGDALDAWVSGDAVEGDADTNPERYAAYLARKEAAHPGSVPDAGPTPPDENADKGDDQA